MLRLVVSHPFDSDGETSNLYEVLTLSEQGQLTSVASFEMERARQAPIVFTPDGRVGMAVQEGGSIGVFRLDERGRPTVAHKSFRGSFFASSLVMHPCGDRVWVLDTQWDVHGGGIYELRIRADGSLEETGCLVRAKLPYALIARPDSQCEVLVAAYGLLGAPDQASLHIVDLEGEPRLVASSNLFGNTEAIISTMALTADGRYALIADHNQFGGIPNRIAVVALTAAPPRVVQAFTPVPDPAALLASPWGGPVLAVSAMGNAIYVLDYDPANEIAPFSWRGELPYHGQGPDLPSTAACVTRGPMAGRVVIGECQGLRQLAFVRSAEGVIDHGLHSLDATGVGALGLCPP